jgi:DNA-binding MarR family transcriptional regulator
LEYPELDKQRRMLEILHRLLSEERERGELSLRLVLSPWGGGGIPVRGRADAKDVAKELGVSGPEAVGLFRRLVADGFIHADYGDKGYRRGTFTLVLVDSLTEKGLREIEELPPAEERLMLGLEAAIRAIREDGSMAQVEKRRRIDVLEEAKQIGRPLAVEIIKAIFHGQPTHDVGATPARKMISRMEDGVWSLTAK